MKHSQLLSESKRYRKMAKRLLSESHLISILEKFGQVEFTGSYAANLMMSGDIDIYVINKSFSKTRVLEIFNKIVRSCKFCGYLFYDWKSYRHPEFPSAYYIGLKTKKGDIKWKIDIWFVTKKDLANIRFLYLKEIPLNKKQKLAILELKKWRGKSPKYISSNMIYDATLNHDILTIPQFKEFLKNNKERVLNNFLKGD